MNLRSLGLVAASFVLLFGTVHLANAIVCHYMASCMPSRLLGACAPVIDGKLGEWDLTGAGADLGNKPDGQDHAWQCCY